MNLRLGEMGVFVPEGKYEWFYMYFLDEMKGTVKYTPYKCDGNPFVYLGEGEKMEEILPTRHVKCCKIYVENILNEWNESVHIFCRLKDNKIFFLKESTLKTCEKFAKIIFKKVM